MNDSLIFWLDSRKVEIISLGYLGPPLSGYEATSPKLVGEVKNLSKEIIVGLRVEVTVYGERMKILVDKRDREIAFWILEPQKKSPFCIYLAGTLHSGDEIRAVKINLIEQKSMKELLEVPKDRIQSNLYRKLEVGKVGVVEETTFVYDELTINHYIRGRIINRGKKTTKSNAVVVVFYDEGGNLIDYRKHSIFGVIAGGELTPGDARIFRLDIPKEVTRYKNYSYKVNIFSIAK